MQKKYRTKIISAGTLINGRVITERFLKVCDEWQNNIPFNVGISVDQYHPDIKFSNIKRLSSKVKNIDLRNNESNGCGIIGDGRDLKLTNVEKQKPVYFNRYWLCNGWLMEPTYLNALGNFVCTDGSYVSQDNAVICHVDNMDIVHFLKCKSNTNRYNEPFGINNNYSFEYIAKTIIKGSPGDTYMHKEVRYLEELEALVREKPGEKFYTKKL